MNVNRDQYSGSKEYLSRDYPCCQCTPLHLCRRNRATQTEERKEGAIALRSLDLIEIPRPVFCPIRTVRDIGVQVSFTFELDSFKIYKEVSLGGQGSSIDNIDTSDLDEIIAEHISPLSRTRKRINIPIPQWKSLLEATPDLVRE
ncbi:hypothetical protein PUN28_015770 [Cardiocondyla obscurior]|uniref:Uncharacterized protein n=1 Tax=Cardiocondyla obscurior TaxID=286306 RepID=A0AAW2EWD9_9HYME